MGHIQPDTHLPKIPDIKVYTAIISQSLTGEPQTITLHNTLGGQVEWTRISDGFYQASVPTLSEIFTPEKTGLFFNLATDEPERWASLNWTDGNTITLFTGNSGGLYDSILVSPYSVVEIRVYNI